MIAPRDMYSRLFLFIPFFFQLKIILYIYILQYIFGSLLATTINITIYIEEEKKSQSKFMGAGKHNITDVLFVDPHGIKR